VAGFAAWQAVRTDAALAEETPAATTTPAGSATPLISVRRTPEYLRGPTVAENLRTDLLDLAADFPTQSCLVVSQGGEEVFAEQPTLPLVPASAQKLVTAFAVYRLLEADRIYSTRLVTDADVVDGVVGGDVWLVGGGDPLLATTDYVDRYEEPQIYTDLERLADAVVAAGITEISGAVVGDETRYDDVRYLGEEVWPPRFIEQNQTGPLSALTVNDGFVGFDSENPASSLATPAGDPARFAAAFFDDLLEARDIVIRRSARVEAAPEGARDLVPPLASAPLQDITNQMTSISDNMAAELLLKEIGLAVDGSGSTAAGIRAVRAALADAGLPITDVGVADGSGLSTSNRVTCRMLVELLESAVDTPLYEGMAVAGESGTMRERLVGTPAEGRVAAKTGRLNTVGALAGVATANDGTEFTFAWIGNTTDFYPLEDMVDVQDRLALELVEYPEGPSVDVLAPIG
jgi:D-alanyl-D-alanine carboxypeptidase/D-alanyl-D-alanine-endopeptidase (penicillin-binding protein 4)